MLAQREQFAEAMVNFDQAMQLDSQNAGIYYERAVALARQGHHDRALDDYARAIELAPAFVQTFDNRGRLLAQLGERAAMLDSGIVTDDILETLQDMSGQAVAVADDPQAAAQALTDLGWIVKPQDNMEAVFLVPFAAGNFIYVAAADLIPEIKKENQIKHSLIHFVAFSLGIGLLLAVRLLPR